MLSVFHLNGPIQTKIKFKSVDFKTGEANSTASPTSCLTTAITNDFEQAKQIWKVNFKLGQGSLFLTTVTWWLDYKESKKLFKTHFNVFVNVYPPPFLVVVSPSKL